MQYDSIYVYNNVYQDRSKDTLLIHEINTEYRYRLLRDTIYRTRIDSIPYEVRIVETKEIKYTPPWILYTAWAGGFSILLLLVRTLRKINL